MLSQVRSFEYRPAPLNSYALRKDELRGDMMLVLFCLSSLLLFISGLVIGAQLSLASSTADDSSFSHRLKTESPVATTVRHSNSTHGRFGTPRWL